MKAFSRYGFKRTFLKAGLLIFLAFSTLQNCSDPKEADELEAGFINPPGKAKPRVWWHWMNGNITKQGIKADLEWMKRSGIGGFQNFDAGLATPKVVEKRLVYMTPEWKDAFSYTAELADSLGLEMAIAGSPGWSESGGPWVKPEEAMKKYVWTETRIEGGKAFSGVLPKPPITSGPFQNMGPERAFGGTEKPVPDYYKDTAVIACRLPDNDFSLSALQPEVSSSGGDFTLSELTDGDLEIFTIAVWRRRRKFLDTIRICRTGNSAGAYHCRGWDSKHVYGCRRKTFSGSRRQW